MENLITDSIKALEDGLTPLIERVKEFKFLPKNKHSKKELNLIIKQINALPKYTAAELKAFTSGLYEEVATAKTELLALIEDFKETPKRHQHQIREEIKALKHRPEMNRKEIRVLELHLLNFPEYTEDDLSALLEYVELFPQNIEKEILATIEEIKLLSLHRFEETLNLIKQIENKLLKEQTKNGLINFLSRVDLIKQLYLTESIKHLEKESQKQLIALVDIIRKRIPKCSMIVLFGSYAKGTEVIYDERIEVGGGRTSYQSDFDIMIVLPNPATKGKALELEGRSCSEIVAEYNDLFKRTLHAPPQFIVECEHSLYESLEIQQPFFTDIMKDGIVLFDDGKITLPEPKELLYKIKKEVALKSFNHLIYGDGFLKVGYMFLNESFYGMGAFHAHQACEKYYRDISMIFINYNPKVHDLERLIEKTTDFSPELATIFPCSTEFEKRAFKLLRDAYIDARYNVDFAVSKEELKYMLERIEVLKEITYRICTERIAYYDEMSVAE